MIQLPIDSELGNILEFLTKNDNLILTASPGSGKTTRVPPRLIKLQHNLEKKIIVLVPKRIAAVGAASRIAEENNWTLGDQVGYQVRFEQRFTKHTPLVFMTTGVFIKKINDENFWNTIGTIVFDEFHERSSLIDLALGLSLERQILGAHLKLIVMSATLNVARLMQYLPEAKHIDVENRVFDLQIIKSKKAQRLNCDHQFMDHLSDTLKQGLSLAKRDALVFLPGLSEIRFAERLLRMQFKNFEFEILHGSIKLEEQRRILQPSLQRRIILTTNIAESSITVASVDLVIDSGLEKKPIIENKIGFSRLELSRISLFSAHQRAGRAARTSSGFCYQLWHEADERSMPGQIEPEILISTLLDETLTLISAGIKNPDQFSWLDKPNLSFAFVLGKLKKLNLVNANLELTENGRIVQICPLDIERSVLFIELSQAGHQKAASRLLAFIESTSADQIAAPLDLIDIRLSDLGRRIEDQLGQLKINSKLHSSDFKETLVSIFLNRLPHKVAKKKEGTAAISSLGRGLEIAKVFVQKNNDFYLLLNGREINSSTTMCDLAIGFSQQEFDKASQSQVEVVSLYDFDLEKMKMYRTEKKTVGYFVLSESQRTYVNESEQPEIFKSLLKKNFKKLLDLQSDYKSYVTKISFLNRKALVIGLSATNFQSEDVLLNQVYESVADIASSLIEFSNLKLWDILLFHTAEVIQKLLIKLPSNYKLPNSKIIDIDYESEQAPKISARIQEMFSVQKNPTILDGQIRMTIELLAPNYRPTQITSQLENFWTTSYFEIRKELKARYPKHPWPDDPANTVALPPRPPRRV